MRGKGTGRIRSSRQNRKRRVRIRRNGHESLSSLRIQNPVLGSWVAESLVQNPQAWTGFSKTAESFDGQSAIVCVREFWFVGREGQAAHPRAPGQCLHFECRGAPARVRAWRCEGRPPLPHHFVCVETFTLLYRTKVCAGVNSSS